MAVKTDRNDARGIAQMLRLGWFKSVHAKSADSQEIRALLAARKLLTRKRVDLDIGMRGILRSFGLKVGQIGRARFDARLREMITGNTMLEKVAELRCSEFEIMAITGHQTSKQVTRYTKGASRKIRAASAFQKLTERRDDARSVPLFATNQNGGTIPPRNHLK